jgi:hypothetical protein
VHLAGRPKDRRGYPIPYSVLIREDGTPDFRIIDREKADAAVEQRRCALCGGPMGRHVAFIGGPLCHVNRYFIDGPMHTSCATFAVQTCPHIVLPKAQYRDADKQVNEGMVLVDHQLADKPDVFMLGVTTKYEIMDQPGMRLIRAAPWISVTWWREGQEVQQP